MMDLSLVHVHIFEPAGMPSRDAWKSYPRWENRVVSLWGIVQRHVASGHWLHARHFESVRRETEGRFQLGCHLQLCPRPHLQWPWLQVVRTCDCPQVIVSLRGQTLVTKGKYSGDTADNLFHRVIQPTPATMRTLIFHLSHKSLRIYNGHLALLYRGVWDILNQYPVKHYHSKKHNSNHLSIHQWIHSAIRASQKPSSPIGVLCLKLPPPPFAVLLVQVIHVF